MLFKMIESILLQSFLKLPLHMQADALAVDRSVTVVRFFSPAMTSLLRNDSVVTVPRRAYRPNETLVLRADFAGLSVFSMQLNAVSTSYDGGPMTLRYNANPSDMVPQIPSVCSHF
jgi:hypothetical protein